MELFSPGHLVILLIVVLVLFFGWKQLPDMARSMGRSMRIFKTEIKGMTEDDKARAAAKEPDTQPKALEATVIHRETTTAVQAPAASAAPRPRPTPAGDRRTAGTPAE